ncbi:hypothetical protein EJ02DRAFT_423457 [Clathrospora elynae]|uniref:Rhodopsin domain-containing protein n=1 Tax=Clathrospora elynae TaxID=706981 RepID=A0A6A5SMS8_9PLEO|nr:hypothetical protein EJ02DRAFT_423457 [Clathrospora elynae]
MSSPLWDAGALVSRDAFLLVSWCGFSIATICVIGRIATRLSVFKCLALDDYFVLLGWSSSLAFSVVWHFFSANTYAAISQMVGKTPFNDTYLSLMYDYTRSQTGMIICQTLGLWFIKYSFLFFFRKMGHQIRHQKILWWTVAVYVSIGLAISISVPPWRCHTNLKKNLANIALKCGTPEIARFTMNTLRVQAAMDITSDAAILSIPLTILWQVRISMRRKLALAGIFALILFIVLCVILRVVIVEKTAVGSYMDVTWLYLWHKIELDVAIIVACLASFRALYTSQRNQSLPTYALNATPRSNDYTPPGNRSWGASVQSGTTVISSLSPSKVHVKKDFLVSVRDAADSS